ncbi:carbamate kinase [Nonomuraea phyllanthi]|uniref:Carbamate kinase n=1 Tax=Nonomuraea phyllanthi TaxID=2219224 RepID=A0A5C4WIG7_9ACTN|nr:carbamate kinase [Nonomuraea phyllanthi]KAB8194090.1 carbamate kinase [Nonomuraea phyllanthi]
MLLVVALGGNALLERGERPDAGVQRRHVRAAARALAPLAAEHTLVLCHGNGPQIGLLAVESENDPALAHPFPLDTLGAQTQGMIGYWLAQELGNAGIARPAVTIVTRTEVGADDPAFRSPTKFVGRGYQELEARRLAREHGWAVARDGLAWRRVVASPEPRRVLELPTIRQLVAGGTTVICGGGGGVPVLARDGGRFEGAQAVVDKDLTAALLAIELGADRLVVLTDVDAVRRDFGTPQERPLSTVDADELRAMRFPAGSMGPKVDACVRFVTATGRPAAIGALRDAPAVLAARAGTTVTAPPGPGTPRAPGVPATRGPGYGPRISQGAMEGSAERP